MKQTEPPGGRRPSRWIMSAGLLGGFALRVQELTLQSLWWDEARNIDVALRPFTQIATAPELDIHPPFYFWALHGWSTLVQITAGMPADTIAFGARFLSVCMGVAGIALVYQLARLVGGVPAGLYAGTVAAASPLWLAESQESRMYSLGFALLAGASAAFVRHLEGRPLAVHGDKQAAPTAHPALQPPLVTFVVLTALSLVTHYNVVFVVAAWFVWWAGWVVVHSDRRRQLRTLVLSAAAVALIISPAAPIAVRQIPDYANPNLGVPDVGGYLIANWQALLGGYSFDASSLYGAGGIWLIAMLALLAAGSVLAIRQRSKSDPALRGAPYSFLLAWLLGGVSLYYFAVLERGAFHPRYTTFVTPALFALIGVSIALWGRERKEYAVAALTLGLLGLVPAAYADIYDQRHFREDARGLARWLRQTGESGDLILVDQKYPFGFYYDRYSIDPTRLPEGPEPADARYLFVDINTVDQRLSEWAGRAQRIFWVEWFESDTDPRGAVSFLLDRFGIVEGEEKFRGYRVRWWKMTPPTHFALAPSFSAQSFAFGHEVETVETSLPSLPVAPGGVAPVVIRWRGRGDGRDFPARKARVALYPMQSGESGRRLAQDDRRILNDRHLAPAHWGASDRPLNVYAPRVPMDTPPGRYELRLLVYDAQTLEPLSVSAADGNTVGLEALLGTVEVRQIRAGD